MKKVVHLVLIATLLITSTQCASIVSKSKYPVLINSDPTAAEISITDRKGDIIFTGKTPAAVALNSGAGFFMKAKYIIKYTKPGYDEINIPIEATLDGWYFGNFGFGGLIGFLIVDPATGAMYKINEEIIITPLKLTSALSNESELKIEDINDVPENLKLHLERIY